MSRPAPHLVIDGPPSGARGPMAGERVLGRRSWITCSDLAADLGDGRSRSTPGLTSTRGSAMVGDRAEDLLRMVTASPRELGDPPDRPALRSRPASGRPLRRGVTPRVGGDLAARQATRSRRCRRRVDPQADFPADRPVLGLARLASWRGSSARPRSAQRGHDRLGSPVPLGHGPGGLRRSSWIARIAASTCWRCPLVLDTADGHPRPAPGDGLRVRPMARRQP